MGAAGLAFLLAGCSVAPTMERLPASMGGLPADAPAKPAAPKAFPAVHDMPPPRVDTPMTDEEQLKAEKALRAAGDRTAGKRQPDDDDADAPKKATPGAKKKPKPAKDSGTDSANTGAKTNP